MWRKFTSPPQCIHKPKFIAVPRYLPSTVLWCEAAARQTVGCVKLCSSLTQRKGKKSKQKANKPEGMLLMLH